MQPNYRPEIDGLRAVAVLPVIAFHAGFSGFSGGFVGVDVFFVISGYLITGILTSDLEQGRFSILRFYERRARRILPALFVVLAASIVAAQFLLMPPPFADFAASVFAVALFLSNMLFIAEVDYFGPAAEATPLLHTWSLAVEEQFYILFPLLLWVLWRLAGRRGVWGGVVVLGLLSLAFSEWAWRTHPAETFYFLPSRAWELLAGSLCAVLRRARTARPAIAQQLVALAGLAAILGSVVLLSRDTPFPSLWAMFPVGGSVAIILFATPGTWVAHWLSRRPVVAVGLISYSAYLWHNPLFSFARIGWPGEPGLGLLLLLSALSLGLAWLSWRFVELPFRHQRGRAPALAKRWQVFVAALAGIAVLVGFGLWGYFSEGRAQLWLRTASPQERQTYALLRTSRTFQRWQDDGGCRFNTRVLDPEVEIRLRECARLHGPGLAILGDSHAIDLADALIEARAAPFLYGMTQGACRPDTPHSDCGYDGFLALVTAQPELFSRAVFTVSGQHLIVGPGERSKERLFALYGLDDEMPAADIHLRDDRIEANARYLETLSRHVPVIWLSPHIEPHIDDGVIMAHGCNYPYALRPGQAAIFDRLAVAIAARLAGQAPALRAVDQQALIHFTMPEDFMTCDALHWADTNHFSRSGRAWLAARVAPALVP